MSKNTDLDFYILLIFSYLPLIFFLDWRISALFFILFFIGLFFQKLRTKGHLIPIKLLAVVVSFYTLWVYNSQLFSLEFWTSFLSFMLMLKLYEISFQRDKYIFLFLLVFSPVSLALYNQSIWVGIYIVVFILIFIVYLFKITNSHLGLYISDFKTCYIIFFQSIPLVFLLFFFFPRLPSAFIGFAKSNIATSGLSQTISPGSFSQLLLSKKVAFRVKFRGSLPNRNELYFRCAVYPICFRGKCRVTKIQIKKSPLKYNLMKKYRYTIYLEPQYNKFIPFLEMATSIPKINFIKLQQGYYFITSKNITAPIGYNILSTPHYILTPSSKQEIDRCLFVERDINPKTQILVQDIIKRSKNKKDILKNILFTFKKNFIYSLTPPKWPEKDFLDFFLFNSKKGFCEHYAIATVYMLRYANIPARVIGGYKGGEENPMGKYLVVFQSNAHAWVEVYLGESVGFVRVDPTLFIPKQNIEKMIYENQQGLFFNNKKGFFMSKISSIWDFLNYKWREAIIGYTYKKQLSFFSKIGLSSKDLKVWSFAIFIVLSSFFLMIGILMYIFSRRIYRDTIVKYYCIFLKRLEQKNVPIKYSYGPMEILKVVRTYHSDLYNQSRQIIDLYIKIRFASQGDEEDIREFKKRVRRF